MRINGASPDYFPLPRQGSEQNPEIAAKLASLQAALAQKKAKGTDVAAELKLLNQARIALNRGDPLLANQIASRAFAAVDIPQKAAEGASPQSGTARTAGRSNPPAADEAAPDLSGDDGGGTYQDSSSDSSVSMKAPTHLSPEAAEYWVRAHEGEHVNHEVARALIEGKRVTNIAVRIYYRYSPKAKKMVPAGGTTFVSTTEKWRPPEERGPIGVNSSGRTGLPRNEPSTGALAEQPPPESTGGSVNRPYGAFSGGTLGGVIDFAA
jgi:hypothetical protein